MCLKSYKDLLRSDRTFEVPIYDVHEFLEKYGFCKNFLEKLRPLKSINQSSLSTKQDVRVAFHDACHMIHGQGISEEPRNLLKKIPNLILEEVNERRKNF